MKNYAGLLANKNVQAFLALIKFTEGADYNLMFGKIKFDSFADHPRQKITRKLRGVPITSSAAGAYQFLSRTWDECQQALDLPDFSPRSQDLAALFLIDRRKALVAVMEGNWETAILQCNKEWASLPGSPYGQPIKSMAVCLAFLDDRTGSDVPVLTVIAEQPAMKTSVISDFFQAFQAGKEVANPATWKSAQLITNRLGVLGVAVLGLARAYGYDFGLTDAHVLSAAGIVVSVVFLFNDVSTVVSTKKIDLRGVPNVPADTGAGGNDSLGAGQDADVFNTGHRG